ncbi:nuclear transport factor 2 family protein [Pseudonocardia sp. CA-107938]|uniref:nuclear transport factor 2 family protein n=1 Tax=Pseudonocardia sp. CA-107938 TaxID=3240021 RepID=UPI003D93B711
MSATDRTAETAKQIVRDFFAAISESDYERAEAMLDPDGEWWTLQTRSVRSLPEQLRRIRSMAEDSRIGVRFTVKSLLAEGHQVAAELESHAELPSFDYNNWYFVRIDVDQDRRMITGLRMYIDTAYTNRVLAEWVAPINRADARSTGS